jgi:AP2 domain.
MKRIDMNQGIKVKVDDEDYEFLNQWKWHKCGKYAVRIALKSERKSDGKQFNIFMHREIMNTPIGMDTDHINGEGFDNRKANLRIVTRSQNLMNRAILKNNKTGHKGVFLDNRNRRKYKIWQATISFNKKRLELGHFYTKEDAIHAYDEAAKKFHGEFAYKN